MSQCLIVYDASHNNYRPKREVWQGQFVDHPDVPERIEAIVYAIQQSNLRTHFVSAKPHGPGVIAGAHTLDLIQYLYRTSLEIKGEEERLAAVFPASHCFDTYTPLSSKVFDAALLSVSIACTGAEEILSGGKVVYALCRPPGHHAMRNMLGGFCYFNNAAIAAFQLAAFGRVAILDLDIHHGNGTQDIFYDSPHVLYVSIHGHPSWCFPYFSGFEWETGKNAGHGFTLNIPLSKGIDDQTYLHSLKVALQRIQDFSARYLVLSLGFDTHREELMDDRFNLTTDCYFEIGKAVKQLDKPLLIIQEGGYNTAILGDAAVAFLSGLQVS